MGKKHRYKGSALLIFLLIFSFLFVSCDTGFIIDASLPTTAVTDTETVNGTVADIDVEALSASLYEASQNEVEGDYEFVSAWLTEWGLTGFTEAKLKMIQRYYDAYFIRELPSSLEMAQDTVSLFCEYFIENIDLNDKNEVTDALISCFIEATGDKYAYYMNAQDYREYSAEHTGVYGGIGVYAVYDATLDGIEITTVFEGSPAEQAGLMIGDIIVGVEGESVASIGYYAAINRIRGEVGTDVAVTVIRGESTQEFTVTRREVVEETVLYRMIENENGSKIGYIRLTGFIEVTAEQFRTAVDTLTYQGAQALMFDLRGNGGGLLTSILEVLDYLLPDGHPLANYLYYNEETATDSGSDGHEVGLPFAVLCNGYTASAAELFTCALQDYANEGLIEATVFGTVTYGKGTMQTSIEFSDNTAMTISIAYYQPPFSDNYEGIGVIPDVEVTLSPELENVNVAKLTEEQDVQLAAAISFLSGESQ